MTILYLIEIQSMSSRGRKENWLFFLFLFDTASMFLSLVLRVLICLNAQLKERAEKLENWKMKEKLKKEMKKDEKELLRHKSSMWIDEQELEKKILEAIVDTTPL